MIDSEAEIIRQIEELEESDISAPEKSERIIKLARKLRIMALEKKWQGLAFYYITWDEY